MTGAPLRIDVPDALSMPLSGINLIEASAGTGKTYTLQHLVLRLVIEQSIPIDRILMVTFTKDATAELVARIRNSLTSTLEGVRRLRRDAALELQTVFPDPVLGVRMHGWIDAGLAVEARLDAAVAGIDQTRIYTIHGFCQKALTEHVLTRNGNLGERIGADAVVLARELVEMFLRRYAEDFSKQHAGEPDLRTRLRSLLGYEDELVKLLAKDFQTIPDPGQIVPLVVYPKVQKDPAEFSETIDKAQMLQAFVGEALVGFRREKARLGLLTFDDMLMQMRDAVRNPAFCDAVASEYDAVLIDEFQDTDSLQYEIFSRLFLEDRHDGHAPVVVFVGDPKQSIYRFRNAQVETYDAAKACIGPRGIWNLTHNHRSAGALVTAINRMFACVGTTTVEGQRPEAVAFSKTQGVSYDASIGPLFHIGPEGRRVAVPEFEIWTDFDRQGRPLGNKENAEKRKLGIYRAVARDIANLISHPVYKADGVRLRASDIAVLVHETKNGQMFKRVLQREHRLGARISENQDVFKTEEGEETLAMLRALVNPQDPDAVNDFIMTRLSGVSYGAVVAPGSDAVLLLRERLHHASELFERKGPLAAFGTLINECRSIERLLTTLEGNRRIANYRHIFELLHAKWRELKTPGSLLHWFENERATTMMPPEDRLVRSEDDSDLVSIVTIHKSKGLEYEVVYCPDLAFDAGHSRTGPILRIPDVKGARSTTDLAVVFGESSVDALDAAENQGSAAGIRAFGTMTLGEGPAQRTLDVKETVVQATMRDACESIRLGYVAMTRAKRRLVLPISVRWNKDGMYAGSRQNILFQTLVDMTGEKGRYKANNTAIEALSSDIKQFTYGGAKPSVKAVLARLESLFIAPQSEEQDFVSDAKAGSAQELLRWRQIDFGCAAGSDTALADAIFTKEDPGCEAIGEPSANPIRIPAYRVASRRDWEQTSFTALIRPLAFVETRSDATADWEMLDDEPEEWNTSSDKTVASDLDALPFGNQTGTCLHGIIERFPDWATSAAALSEVRHSQGFDAWADAAHPHNNLYREVARALESSGLSGADPEQKRCRNRAVLRMLRDVLNKSLTGKRDRTLASLEGMTLAKAASIRMAEALFFLEMNQTDVLTKTAHDLGLDLARYGYGIDGLEARPLQGFIKGEIDVVFHWKGRFWILDWKTNRIGSEPDPKKRFTRESMHDEILRHGYQLQYLLYATALRRMLRLKFPGTDPNTLIGGALYVFLRGVNDNPDDLSGFYCDPAGKDFLGALDAIDHALGWQGGAR